MSETSESLLNLINASGFLFQLRVEQEIKEAGASNLGNVELTAREHRWVDSTDGTEGFIDLVLTSGIGRWVIECKRVTDATWAFLVPDNQDQTSRARLLWTSLTQSKVRITEWHDFGITPSSPEAAFCIVRGQGERDTPMLERISSLLLRSLESLASEEINYKTQAYQERSIYYPVIVTNATLQVCRFNPLSVDIATGRLNDVDLAEFEEVPFVRFRKNLSSTLVSNKPQSNLKRANSENERTVFVINAKHLVPTIQSWNIPYEKNAPWPWEGFKS